ncbi:hypothetical protein BU197_26130 [Streptomyces sp. CBMA291]|nr:hypothetical protein [Streptomyces sp. CBMA291]
MSLRLLTSDFGEPAGCQHDGQLATAEHYVATPCLGNSACCRCGTEDATSAIANKQAARTQESGDQSLAMI